MYSIRVTAPDGSTRTLPFPGTQACIGRSADNDIVLEGSAISAHHCMLELQGGVCTLKERGSTNGTWLNNERVDEPTPITERDRIYVGSYLVELTRLAPAADVRPTLEPPPQLAGPLLRTPSPDRAWRDMHARLERYAEAWDNEDRPARLALSTKELEQARKWLARAGPDKMPPVTTLQRELIATSEKLQGRRRVKVVVGTGFGVLALAGMVTGGVMAWPMLSGLLADDSEPAETDAPEEEPPEDPSGFFVPEDDQGEDGADDVDPDKLAADVDAAIVHRAIPGETLQDVAQRYQVSVADIADWNLINPDTPLAEGQELKIERPGARPLPQQKVTYEVEPGETWTAVSERFGVPVTQIRGYNDGIDRLESGTKLTIWIDPKPYAPRDPPLPVPEFHIDQRAVSMGAPNAGKLEHGIQMPHSDLYTRRYPNIMWGSSTTIANLQKAVATFRRDVAYDGEVIIADISRQHGGKFPPHQSHQAGRDVDIWLPTLKGVYKRKYLEDDIKGRPYRPSFSEIDWYATWGLARALIQTGAVKEIFLDWDRQQYVYEAAVNMGATKEQLDEWIQYPRQKRSSRGIFRHSKNHFTHMHVRFLCASWERECRDSPIRSTEE